MSGRYPEASPLPDPPELDRLLRAAGLDLKWDAGAEKGRGAYVFPSYEAVISGSGEAQYRYPTGTSGGIPGVWMLIPGDGQSHLPFMEGKAVPVIGSGQHARVPVEWLENRHRRGRKGKARVEGETQSAGE